MYNNSQLKALYIVKYRPYDNVEKTSACVTFLLPYLLLPDTSLYSSLFHSCKD